MIPFLFEMRPSDVHGPLADLMGRSTSAGSAKNQEEFRKLLVSLNTAKTPPCAPEAVLNTTFEKMWPDFAPRARCLGGGGRAPGRGTSSQGGRPVGGARRRAAGGARPEPDHWQRHGDRRWTFRGNARLDPLSWADYRQIALGLEMLKTLAEIDEKGYYHPPGSTVKPC